MAATVVLLNVGGKLFSTTAATLQSPLARGSMLGTLAALHVEGQGGGMQATCTDPRHPGALFIDRDGDSFGYILNYLRDGQEMVLPADHHISQLVLREARYYQLTGLIQLLEGQASRLLEAEVEKQHQLKMSADNEAEKQQRALVAMEQMKEALAALCSYLVPGNLYQNPAFEYEYEDAYFQPSQLIEEVKALVGQMVKAICEK